MRFKYKTYIEKFDEKIAKYSNWYNHFALLPIWYRGSFYWLTTVQRRINYVGKVTNNIYFEFK
jgi:hypothetical protein